MAVISLEDTAGQAFALGSEGAGAIIPEFRILGPQAEDQRVKSTGRRTRVGK